MRLLSKIFAGAAFSLAASLAACGTSDAPPGPLARHFDDMYIASIGLEQKTAIVNQQQAWSVAKMENAKADADLQDVQTSKLPVARNELKTLHIAVDTAVTEKKAAQQSNDTTKINSAAKNLDTASKLEKAGQAHVHYLEVYLNYLKATQRYTAENMYWQEAKFEAAKSQLAQQNHIAPQNIKHEWYPSQEAERGRRVEGAKAKWEARRNDAQKARDQWLSVQKEADTAAGNITQTYDPMAPAPAPAPAPMPAPAPTPAPAQ